MPVVHIVLFKFKPSTSEEQINDVMDALGTLKSKFDGIVSYSSGPNISTENLHKGLTHGFTMKFKDAASRDAYLPHEEHVKVAKKLIDNMEDIVVFDYEE
ncbi:hypothetical protein AKO1_011696 [Acrasis kona]|uniref:Stress-response A/B barrel domain-containing protein n=1 Tax=Acrasis kona TaxID=1008807 RepID=A0AAW2Z7B7_9EUKA